jgi:type IV pilus assembly protein PilY1
MANGSWAAIVANGYGSTSNKAVLYIVNVETGQIIKRIDTEAGSSTSPNGLSTPIAVDINNDRIVDYVYAGDLLGNMWKFDVTNSSASQWDVAYKSGSTPKPLFVACVTDTTSCSSADRQPITAKPQVGRVGADQNGGVMVYFGTGKYFEVGDNTVDANNDGVVDAQKQTFYGIWDNGAAVSRRADLQVQTIDEELTRGGFGLRVSSNTAVDYSTKKGWFMDLVKPPSSTLEGERVVSFPLLRGGRLIFTTLIPSPHPCEFGGTGWIMELDAVTGSRLPSAGGPPWDIYGSSGAPDGAINSQDLVRSTTSAGCTSADCSPSGKKSNIGIIKTPGVISAGEKEYKYTSGSSGALEVTTESAGGAGGRQSWRQLR